MTYAKCCNLTGIPVGMCQCLYHGNITPKVSNMSELISYEDSMGVLSSYGNLGAGRVRRTAKQILEHANNLITPLPVPVQTMIDNLPISRSQKNSLKRHPISFFIVLADAARDKIIEFINRVEGGRKRRIYKVGRSRVRIDPKRSDSAVSLAVQMLAVSFNNPLKAASVSARMQFEIGTQTLKAVGAGVGKVARDVSKTIKKDIEDVKRSASKAGRSASRSARRAGSAIKKGLSKLNPFGEFDDLYGYGFGAVDGGVVSGPAAAATGGAAAATTTGITLNSIVAVMTAAAPIVVPVLQSINKGMKPEKPTVVEIRQSEQAAKSTPVISNNQTVDGPSVPVVLGGIAVVGVVGYLITSSSKK